MVTVFGNVGFPRATTPNTDTVRGAFEGLTENTDKGLTVRVVWNMFDLID
jgi:hypothetical protein